MQQQSLERAFSIAASRAPSSAPISTASVLTSVPAIPTTKSLKISRRGSTSTGGDCSPFWTERSAEESKRLWLPTGIGSAASPSSSSSTCLGSAGAGSWFATVAWRQLPQTQSQTISEKTSCPSSPTSSQAITAAALRRTERDACARLKRLEMATRRREKKEAKLTPEQREQGALRREKDAKKRSEADGMVARRIRIWPTAEQRELLLSAFGASRYIYNKGVEITNAQRQTSGKPITGKMLQKSVRGTVTNNDVWSKTVAEKQSANWVGIPYEVRDSAVRDLAKATKSSDARCESEATSKGVHAKAASWEFKFRCKKSPTESLTLRSRDLDRATHPWFRAIFGTPDTRYVMRSKQTLPRLFERDTRLLHDKVRRRYYLVVPVKLTLYQSGSDIKAPRSSPSGDGTSAAASPAAALAQRQLSLDPGVRTFMTGYDPSGLAVEWGCDETNAKLWRLANTANGIRSRMVKPQTSHKRRRHMRRAAARVGARIRNMVDELHHKFASWACTNYDLILLPEFRVKSMSKRGRRRISRKTVSQMYSLAHYRFRQFMQHKAKQCGTTLFLVNEAHTSKTCGRCGKMHDVGTRKLFTCPHCGLVVDRDIGAARNIAIKFIHDNQCPTNVELPLTAANTATLM